MNERQNSISVKNVLLVHEKFPPDFAGGGEYVVLKTAQGLQELGINVTVLTTGDPSITEYEGIKTKRLPISTYLFNFKWKIAATYAASADIIHSFSYHGILPAFLAGKRLGKPVVCEILALFDSAWREMKGPFFGTIFQQLEHFLIGLPASAKIYLSDFSYDLAKKCHLNSKNDFVIEPGISLEDYRCDACKSYVLFAGKLDVRKGINLVLESAVQLPDIPFKIMGWGSNYETLLNRLPENVELSMVEDRLELAEAMAKARIFVFPTKAETFGLAVAEAMAAGCAIVSSSMLPFEGIRISFNDQDGITNAIKQLWNNPAICTRMGKKNWQTVQTLNWNRHIDALLNVYRDILL